MEGNVFSTYTNTVREIFADTDESIAKFIADSNIDSVWEPQENWNGNVEFYHINLRLPVKVFKQLEKEGLLENYENALAKTEHPHPLGMVVSTHFRCGKGVKRGLKNGALPFNID